MEAKFVVHRIPRREDMTAFARFMYVRAHIVRIVFALLCWAMFAYEVYCYYWDIYHTLMLAMALLFTLYAVFFPRFMGWRTWRSRNQKVEGVTLAFCDDGVRISSNLDEGRLQYKAFLRLAENSKYYFLFIQKRSAYMLPKDLFTQGDPAEFGAFIAAKTGLEIKRVKR